MNYKVSLISIKYQQDQDNHTTGAKVMNIFDLDQGKKSGSRNPTGSNEVHRDPLFTLDLDHI